jgi:hypothetical protein
MKFNFKKIIFNKNNNLFNNFIKLLNKKLNSINLNNKFFFKKKLKKRFKFKYLKELSFYYPTDFLLKFTKEKT